MSKKKSIAEQVKKLKPSIVHVFEGKKPEERVQIDEIISALDIKLNAFKRSIFFHALFELTNESVLRHHGYSMIFTDSKMR